jgi:hypothetical protein
LQFCAKGRWKTWKQPFPYVKHPFHGVSCTYLCYIINDLRCGRVCGSITA